MLRLSDLSLNASVAFVFLALACYIAVLALGRARRPAAAPRKAALAGVAGRGSANDEQTVAATPEAGGRGLAFYGTAFAQISLLVLTVSLVARTVATGHGPFANQYEFAVAFGWGVLVAYVFAAWQYHVRTLGLVVLPIAAALLVYAVTVGSTALPLVPALQNSQLLTLHVAFAILAYGALSVACAAGVLYLIQPESGRKGLPRPELLDEIAYRAVIIAFPMLTLVIVLGAVWANQAWGTYWSWDPKETASLLTWLIYGAYLHARVARGWRGRKAAWLLMLGFAAVLFTFFGNLFFGGLHSYSGVAG